MDSSSIMFSKNDESRSSSQKEQVQSTNRNTFLSGIFNKTKPTDDESDSARINIQHLNNANFESADSIALNSLSESNSSMQSTLDDNLITQHFATDRMIESDQETSSSSESGEEQDEQAKDETDQEVELEVEVEDDDNDEHDEQSDNDSMKYFRANIHTLDTNDDGTTDKKQKQGQEGQDTDQEKKKSMNTNYSISNGLSMDGSPFGLPKPNNNINKKKLFQNNLPKQETNDIQKSFLFRKKSNFPTPGNMNDNYSNIDLESNQNGQKDYVQPAYTATMRQNIISLSKKEKALWKWANIENLDLFLIKVYNYYLGSGFKCILVEKFLNLFTLIFITFFGTFSTNCIDYSKFHQAQKLQDIVVEQCYKNSMTNGTKFLIYLCMLYVVLKLITIYNDYKELLEIHDFFSYLLEIDDLELQTISWQNIVSKIMDLKDSNALTANVHEIKAKNRINAHDIANRIMRKENYLIALFNAKILDLDLNVPLSLRFLPPTARSINLSSNLTKTLEWNINLCIIGYAFNEQGYLKHYFLKKSQRTKLIAELKKRFMVAGFLNIILSPILVSYFVLLYFFRYFHEYKSTPGAISTRQYTLRAEWKLREYNELYHLFQKRLGLSIEIADDYVNQFPNEFKNLILKFIAFITGSFVAILAIFTLFFDSENFLNFEISKDKSVLFYLSIFGTVYTVCKSSISDQYKVFDPELYMLELVKYTHYQPKKWENKLHTQYVRDDFCRLYDLKLVVLLKELSSLLVTPFILWFKLPSKSDEIVDFFRNVSIYVDGLGYVCKYAVFDKENDTLNSDGISDGKSRKFTKGQKKQSIRTILKKRYESNPGMQDNTEINNKPAKQKIKYEIEQDDKHDNEEINDKIMQSYIHFVDNYSNVENNVGKTAIPRHVELNGNYTWKKQFGFSNNMKRSQLLTAENGLRPTESLSPNSSSHNLGQQSRLGHKSSNEDRGLANLNQGSKFGETQQGFGKQRRPNLFESDSLINQSSSYQDQPSSIITDPNFGPNTTGYNNHTNQNHNMADHSIYQGRGNVDQETNTKRVLGLLKQYYKDADVGR
ncbi:hypothetical protein ACO0RG_004250 [Hanseniaspora osmophila]|uniref:Autophagy-related protein 9 n=1 Tax=Hanseniaspora osmophila TaxID=56408 RepID=A0A1E5RBU4_9ASCO|nr:Autophagy-related protein 9 [Hanseniaspora osmophila]